MLRRPEVALFAIVFGAYAYFYQGGGWNENTRFDLTRALVEQHTARIDAYHHNTGDLAQHDGHFYCDKAPGTSWLAVPAYAVIYGSGGSARPSLRFLSAASYLSRLWAVSLPSALGVVALSLCLSALGVPLAVRLVVALAYGLATLAFPYSTALIGHQLAAAALLVSFALLVRARREADAGPLRLFLAGAALGAAVVVEYPAALAVVPLGLHAAASPGRWRRLAWLAAGMVGPLAALAIYHWSAFGSPLALPYHFSTLPDRHAGLFMGIGVPDPSALFHLLFSSYRGLFFSAPWLLWALPGLAFMWRRGLRAEGAVCAAVPLLFVWLNSSLVDWQGGWALGARYLVPAIPFLAIAAGVALSPRGPARTSERVSAALAGAAALYSFALMLMGTAVKVDVPIEVRSPFLDFIVPAFRDGRLAISTHSIDSARHLAPEAGVRFAWNLGELMGLQGHATLIPLALFVALGAMWLVWAARRGETAGAPRAVEDVWADVLPFQSTREDRAVAALLVAAAVVFGVALLWPEWWNDPPQLNDNVLHRSLATYAAEHWDEHWAVDHWFPSISDGFPVFAYYPHLSHLCAAAIAHVFGTPQAAGQIYATLSYLLLAAMPLSIFWSLRHLGLAPRAAALGGLLYPLITAGYDGIGWSSYVWRGPGLMPQLWGTFFIFPALACGYDAVRGGRCWAAGVLLGACTLAHFIYGYIAALSLALLVFVPIASVPWPRRLVRLAGVGALTAAVTAYFAVPFALTSGVLLKSRWQERWRWDSMGWDWIIPRLLRGEMFDAGNLPVITALVGIGIGVASAAAWRRRDPVMRWALLALPVWIVLYLGRPTLGWLVDALPLASGLHMNRFLAGVQVFGVLLAAVGLNAAIEWIGGMAPARFAAGVRALLLGALLAAPAAAQLEYMRLSGQWAGAAQAGVAQGDHLRALEAVLRMSKPGRVHAGLQGTWGRAIAYGGVPAYGLLQADGFDMVGYLYMAMARPADWQMLFDYRRPEHCDLFNARYVVAPAALSMPEVARRRAESGDLALYEMPTSGYFALGAVDPLPPDVRVPASSLAAEWEAIYQIGAGWLTGSGPAAHRFLSLGPPRLPLPPDAGHGSIGDESIAAGTYGVRVAALAEADLILKVTYHPWWRCTVDGVRVRPIPVIPGFMAVRLAPGVHDVWFTYEPPWWKHALFYLSLATVALAAIAGLRRA